jgi:hypothetical protein
VACLLRITPKRRRGWLLMRVLKEAGRADAWMRATGQAHPIWGDGSLMASALRRGLPSEPRLSDRDYCGCLALVYATIGNRPVAREGRLAMPGRGEVVRAGPPSRQ